LSDHLPHAPKASIDLSEEAKAQMEDLDI
jgi:hypothetical protein